jgi:predicted acyl esterase
VLDPHPALEVVAEAVSPADQVLGDDFHHNGAFRLSYGFEYAALLEANKETNSSGEKAATLSRGRRACP